MSSTTHAVAVLPERPLDGADPHASSCLLADSRLAARGEAMASTDSAAQPAGELSRDPFAEWTAAARAAGHPVLSIAKGRFHPDPLPVWSPQMPPNDLLHAAQEYARAGVEWVHVLMPSMASLLALGEAIRGPRPAGPAIRRGLPTAVSWPRLVAEQHIGPSAISVTRNGVTDHALDLPLSWLSCPITRAGPPGRPVS
jgi:hypothetical protein